MSDNFFKIRRIFGKQTLALMRRGLMGEEIELDSWPNVLLNIYILFVRRELKVMLNTL